MTEYMFIDVLIIRAQILHTNNVTNPDMTDTLKVILHIFNVNGHNYFIMMSFFIDLTKENDAALRLAQKENCLMLEQMPAK